MSHKRKKKRFKPDFTSFVCIVLALLLIGFILFMFWCSRHPDASFRRGGEATAAPTATDAPTNAPTATPTAVPTATPTAVPTAVPTPTPTAEPVYATVVTPEPEAMSSLSELVTPTQAPGFLPVCFGCDTSRKVVAITIDDCNQPGNLKKMVNLIAKYDGAATIFPIGENIEMCAAVLKSAWEQGFELENHTWSHCGLYDADDETFCEQIWRQDAAIDELLGVDYQMHFLRPRGGDDRFDQRTHTYISQLGYYGIAYWTQVGVLNSTSSLMKNVSCGNVFLFHTTDEDLAQLQELVPKLHKAGYELVTLNELYGLPDNETPPLTDHTEVLPLAEYQHMDQTYRKEDYLHDVYLIQERLTELGFLNVPYNGYYGSTTANAVSAFQASVGLTADGICGPDTWNALFKAQPCR